MLKQRSHFTKSRNYNPWRTSEHFSWMHTAALQDMRKTHTYLRLQHLAGVTWPLVQRPAAGHSWGCECLLWDPSLEVWGPGFAPPGGSWAVMWPWSRALQPEEDNTSLTQLLDIYTSTWCLHKSCQNTIHSAFLSFIWKCTNLNIYLWFFFMQ